MCAYIVSKFDHASVYLLINKNQLIFGLNIDFCYSTYNKVSLTFAPLSLLKVLSSGSPNTYSILPYIAVRTGFNIIPNDITIMMIMWRIHMFVKKTSTHTHSRYATIYSIVVPLQEALVKLP